MKINFGLLGLAAAQSGDERWEDSSYDYDSAGADRWSNNDWNFSNVQAGVTFTDFGGRTTGQLDSNNFVKALKLSCWNSNMIRDMNNDNRFDSHTRGTTDNNTLYKRGDLVTGLNHQYGFEYTNHLDADNGGLAGQNEGTTNGAATSLLANSDFGIRDTAAENSFRKWGYQNDNVERAASDGYDEDIVAFHFGHGDNTLNTANRPNKFDDCTGNGAAYDCSGTDGKSANFHGYADDWRYSLRMGGCLYEAQQWFYDENSFNRVGRLTYSDEAQFILDTYSGSTVNNNGIFEADSAADRFNDVNDSVLRTPTAGGVFADVHWVHVFNAHVFPIRDVGYYSHVSGNTDSNDSLPSSNVHGFKTESDAAVRADAAATLSKKDRQIEDFNVVMANPTYEGHGFLNFVATYHDHVEDYDQGDAEDTEPDRATVDGKNYTYVGYRFLSTIGGLTTATADTRTTCGHVRTVLAGENDNRCGSAVYDNFGDWYFRPAQTYSKKATTGHEQMGYWAYILNESYDPYNYADASSNLWTAASSHYDSSVGGRGFSISSFPHNELGKDFRFNIRTLHNMGAGVAKSFQRISALSGDAAATHLSTSSMVWSYYMYAVDTIKIAFPEFVARINHCTGNTVACRAEDVQDIIIDGATMKSSAAPGATVPGTDSRYVDGNTQYGFERIMGADDHSSAVARLHLDDAAFDYANRDNHDDTHTDNQGAANCAAYTFSPNAVTDTNFANPHGYTENRQPWKPCASWCGKAGDANDPLCGRVLEINGLLKTYDELHLRQYGSIQEVWVQLQYAYFETFDDNRDITNANVDSVRGTDSPFPNIFFSAPEVVDIIGSCPSSNMKCRGYMNDENQPYAGSRTHNARVYTNGNPSGFAPELPSALEL
jgi:hypothetical protein